MIKIERVSDNPKLQRQYEEGLRKADMEQRKWWGWDQTPVTVTKDAPRCSMTPDKEFMRGFEDRNAFIDAEGRHKSVFTVLEEITYPGENEDDDLADARWEGARIVLTHYEIGDFAKTGTIEPHPVDAVLLPKSQDHRTARLRQWERIVRANV